MRSCARRSRFPNSSGLMIPSASGIPAGLLPIPRQGFPGLLQNGELVVGSLQGNLSRATKLLCGLTRFFRRGSGVLRGSSKLLPGCSELLRSRPGTFRPAALLLPELADSFLALAEGLSRLAV